MAFSGTVNNLFLGLLLIFQLEMFITFVTTSVLFYSNTLKLPNIKKTFSQKMHYYNTKILFLLMLTYLLTLKGNVGSVFIILVAVIFILYMLDKDFKQIQLYHKQTYNSNHFIFSFLASSLFFVVRCTSLLDLFIFIELYGVLYYFFLLATYNFTSQTFLKYKNSLILLLWNNFVTSLFLIFGCWGTFKENGTTDFAELLFLGSQCNYIYIYFIGLFWKIGFPLFHFFKVEVYKFLLKENIFFFSISTLIINFFLLYFFLTKPIIFILMNNSLLLLLSVVVAINLACMFFKTTTIYQYLAISSLLTITTVFIIFIF